MPILRTHSPDKKAIAIVDIQPARTWYDLSLREVWARRDLLYFLIWRDLKARYRQTILGGAWAILQPLFTMVVFSVFFGGLAKLPSDGLPYPVFSFCALVPWSFFSSGLQRATGSIVSNAGLITKVYFPRLAAPLTAVLSGIVDFGLAFLVLLAMMLFYGKVPTANALWLPLFLLLAMLTALGAGLWFAALNVRFRDVQYIVAFLIQFWLYATPIAYSSSLLSDKLRLVYSLNPMVTVIEGFRWSLLGISNISVPTAAASTLVALVLVVSGLIFFQRMQDTFADTI